MRIIFPGRSHDETLCYYIVIYTHDIRCKKICINALREIVKQDPLKKHVLQKRETVHHYIWNSQGFSLYNCRTGRFTNSFFPSKSTISIFDLNIWLLVYFLAATISFCPKNTFPIVVCNYGKYQKRDWKVVNKKIVGNGVILLSQEANKGCVNQNTLKAEYAGWILSNSKSIGEVKRLINQACLNIVLL